MWRHLLVAGIPAVATSLLRLSCALAVLFPPAAAAAPAPRFTRLSVEQGLSQSTVQVILQDHIGFLWFGTEEGLNRYDGYSFVAFKHDPQDRESLPDDMVSTLYEDRQRRLWVGTDGGLSLFDRGREKFSRVPAVQGRVTGIVEDPDGTLWVGTDEGLFARNPATGAFVAHLRNPLDPATLAGHNVSALVRDRRGRLWVGTRDSGVDLFDDGTGRFSHHRHDPRDPRSLGHDEVWGMAEDHAGRLWVATYGGGLSVRDPETGAFRHYRHRAGDPRSLRTDLLTCVLVDRAGTVWVGTDGGGVQRYDPARDGFSALLHEATDSGSLSRNVVRSLYQDGQGQLWVGTFMGGANLLKQPRHAFGYLTHSASDPSSLTDPLVASFLEDDQGRLWVGTEKGRLHRYQRETGTFTPYLFLSDLPGAAILSLHQDRRGRIWVGSYRGGLGRFDPARGTFVTYRQRPEDEGSLSDDEIWAIAEDHEGFLWLGTNTRLDRFDPERGVVTHRYDTPTNEGLGNAGVRALLVDREGNLWVGTLGGLNVRLRGGADFVRYRHDVARPDSLSNDRVVSLHQDARGVVWAGTLGGGLNRFDRDRGAFTRYRDLPSRVVYAIEEEPSGRLWLSTSHGLVRFDPATGGVESFDSNHGLQTLEFHLGASLRTRQGRLLFGSFDGLYDFDPQEIRPDPYAPPVVVTSLRVFSERVKLPGALPGAPEIALSHRDKVFSLEFAALDYTFPRRNRYAYKLEGFSDPWIELGNRREVTFTNLDPGTYVFRVKASNSDGVWHPSSTTALRVVIRPPFWGTWWFRAVCLAAVLATLAGTHRLRVGRLTAALQERQRNEEALRQAEEKYRGIFENAVEGIYQSTPGGRFLTANPALARMLGYRSPSELLSEVTDIQRQLYVDGRRRGEMHRLLEEKGVIHGFEIELRRRDGSTVWVSESIRAVRDEAGHVRHYEGSSEDISDRRRAQHAEWALRAALQKASVEWERTFDSIEAMVVVLDGRGAVVRINRAVREGRAEDEDSCLGRPVTDLGPGEPWRKAQELALEVEYTSRGAQAQVHDPDTRRTWDLTATPVQGVERAEQRTIVVARDVTRMVELQESLRRSETMSAMGSLLAGVAHEVRNPLFGISANLDSFEARFGEHPEYTEVVGRVRGEVNRLVRLMHGLLDFGRPVGDERVPGALWEVVAEALAGCQPLAGETGVEVRSAVPQGLPAVLMDRGRLVQAFDNLVRNAVQHSPAGGKVVVEAAPERRNGVVWLRCTVRDGGPGFRDQDRASVFQPFFTRRRGGTGLGLPIVQRIVEGHRGTVTVGNHPAGGAEVTVRLPCVS